MSNSEKTEEVDLEEPPDSPNRSTCAVAIL